MHEHNDAGDAAGSPRSSALLCCDVDVGDGARVAVTMSSAVMVVLVLARPVGTP